MRIATWNMHRGRGAFGPFRPALATAVISEVAPGLLALQEAQHFTARKRPMVDEASLTRDVGLRALRVVADQQGYRSNLLLVRTDARILRGPVGIRLGGLEPRGAIMADLDLGEGAIRVVTAHLSLGAGTRTQQARILLDALSEWPTLPCLLLGDLNERKRDGSAMRVLAPSFGVPPQIATFPSFRPSFALDRILVTDSLVVEGLRAHDTPVARRASDHLPLVARLGFAPR